MAGESVLISEVSLFQGLKSTKNVVFRIGKRRVVVHFGVHIPGSLIRVVPMHLGIHVGCTGPT